jgi:hypothetical protein
METPETLLLWLHEQSIPLLAIALTIALILVVLFFSARAHRIRMNEMRAGSNEDTFVDSLADFGFDPAIARATYQYLQDKQRVCFPIEAADKLDEDLGLDSDDVDETVVDLLAITGRLYRPGVRPVPLVTVEDLIRLVQASPRLAALAA